MSVISKFTSFNLVNSSYLVLFSSQSVYCYSGHLQKRLDMMAQHLLSSSKEKMNNKAGWVSPQNHILREKHVRFGHEKQKFWLFFLIYIFNQIISDNWFNISDPKKLIHESTIISTSNFIFNFLIK